MQGCSGKVDTTVCDRNATMYHGVAKAAFVARQKTRVFQNTLVKHFEEWSAFSMMNKNADTRVIRSDSHAVEREKILIDLMSSIEQNQSLSITDLFSALHSNTRLCQWNTERWSQWWKAIAIAMPSWWVSMSWWRPLALDHSVLWPQCFLFHILLFWTEYCTRPPFV